MYNDTIAAVSTACGDAGIGIVRLSGPESLPILQRIFRHKGRGSPALQHSEFTPASHRLYYGFIVDPESGTDVDEVLATYMAPPGTYTREPMVEINSHGGPVPLQEVLGLVLRSGARLANPGEFTLRAFLNGRIDLSQAEAVLDVVRARTRAGLQAGLRQLTGGLSSRVREVRGALLRALAQLEATIDFPEDEVPEAELDQTLKGAAHSVRDILQTAAAGIAYRQGVRVAIVGRPNVGKSSLLNALLRFERAIVTDIPGTTRDTVEETVNIRGVPFVLVDTAGISTGGDLVEQIGVQRSRSALREAGLVVVVLDGSTPLAAEDLDVARLVREAREETAAGSPAAGPGVVAAVNKADLPIVTGQGEVERLLPSARIARVSALTGEGISQLEGVLLDTALAGRLVSAESVLVTNARHEKSLRAALDHLESALQALEDGLTPDLMAVDLRQAIEALGEITGETVGEALLEHIFSDFCIGK